MATRTTSRKDTILQLLRHAPATAAFLGWELNAPDASVRRNIQELRAEGHNIVYDRPEFRLVEQTRPETAPHGEPAGAPGF